MNNQIGVLIQEFLTNHSKQSIGAIKNSISATVNYYLDSLCSSEDAVDEIRNRIYEDVFNNIGKLNNLNDFYNFVRKYTRNQIRTDNIDRYSFDNDYLNYMDSYTEEKTDNTAVLDDDIVRQSLEKLDCKERMVFLMKYYDGLQIDTIADELDINTDMVKGIISKAQNIIRENDVTDDKLIDNLKHSLATLERRHQNNTVINNTNLSNINNNNFNSNQSVNQAYVAPTQNGSWLKSLSAPITLLAIFIVVGLLTGMLTISKTYPYARMDYVKSVTTTYDSSDEVISVVTEKYEDGQLVENIEKTRDDTVTTEYKYDDNRMQIEYKQSSRENGLKSWYRRLINTKGDIVKVLYFDEDGYQTSTLEQKYRYNLFGLRTSLSVEPDDTDGYSYKYFYDLKGRLTKEEQYDADDNLVWLSEYKYDFRGNRTLSHHESFTSDYSYDTENTFDRNNMLKETQRYYNGNITYIGHYKNGRIQEEENYDTSGNLSSYVTYEYDSKGRQILKETRDNNDELIEYTKNVYDSSNRLIKSYTYDADDNLKSYQKTEYYNR